VGSRTVDIYVPRGKTCPVIMSDVLSFFSSAWQCDRVEIVIACVFDVHANNYVVWELAVLWGLSREFHSLVITLATLIHWQKRHVDSCNDTEKRFIRIIGMGVNVITCA
jgi:hypothetical protein